jgi:hypothetical protein
MPDMIVRDARDNGVRILFTDMGDGTHAERLVAMGSLGSPGFMRGREFRSFHEFSVTGGSQIPANQRVLFRFVLGANMLLESLEISIDDGQVRVTSHAGGVATGVFTAMPVIPANSMVGVPVYATLTGLAVTPAGLPAAVNITGSVLRDVFRVKTPAGGGASMSVPSTIDSVRGLPIGATFYVLVENNGAGPVEGTLRLRWQEPI